jgi:hypothetical protein
MYNQFQFAVPLVSGMFMLSPVHSVSYYPEREENESFLRTKPNLFAPFTYFIQGNLSLQGTFKPGNGSVLKMSVFGLPPLYSFAPHFKTGQLHFFTHQIYHILFS